MKLECHEALYYLTNIFPRLKGCYDDYRNEPSLLSMPLLDVFGYVLTPSEVEGPMPRSDCAEHYADLKFRIINHRIVDWWWDDPQFNSMAFPHPGSCVIDEHEVEETDEEGVYCASIRLCVHHNDNGYSDDSMECTDTIKGIDLVLDPDMNLAKQLRDARWAWTEQNLLLDYAEEKEFDREMEEERGE